MGVDFIRHIAAGMSEESAYRVRICSGVVEERGASVAAVVCGVAAAMDEIHHAPPDVAVSGIVIRTSRIVGDQPISGALHP